MIHHILLTKFPDEEITRVITGLSGLRDVPGVSNFVIDKHVNPRAADSYSHRATMSFADPKALQTYVDHPLHKSLSAEYVPAIEKPAGMDLSDD